MVEYHQVFLIINIKISFIPYTTGLKLLTITQTDLIYLNCIGKGVVTENCKKAVESADQDQPAHTCRLILLYTLRKINT